MDYKSASSTYATLSSYNGASAMGVAVPQGTVSGTYVVPSYGAIGYSALTHGVTTPSASGYFGIRPAYKSEDGSCKTQFSRSSCM